MAPRRSKAPIDGQRNLAGLLAARDIVVTCGPGGVGKTTVAAASALMAAAHHGGKVLVLTVDPARRLADALGLAGIGNVERQVAPEAFSQAGLKPRGQLWAAMIDTQQSWDDLIRRHAPDRKTQEKILENPLYRNIAGRFVNSHDYIAMERLYALHSEGDYDLIVVDTPPTRNALDFLDAPDRMTEFFSSRLLKWLVVPYRSKLVNLASKPFYQIADRILGTQFLADISEFLLLFQTMSEGFTERAAAVHRLMGERRTSFVVVSTLEAVPLAEAGYFAGALTDRGFHFGAMVLNKVLPDYLRDAGAAKVARQLAHSSEGVAQALAKRTDIPAADMAAVLQIAGRSFLDFKVAAECEAEQLGDLTHTPEALVKVPYMEGDITDIRGLAELGRRLFGES